MVRLPVRPLAIGFMDGFISFDFLFKVVLTSVYFELRLHVFDGASSGSEFIQNLPLFILAGFQVSGLHSIG
jgi:hypothetical protein